MNHYSILPYILTANYINNFLLDIDCHIASIKSKSS